MVRRRPSVTHLRAACAVGLLLVSQSLAQAVLRVGPGRAFTDLQPAIDAALPGDWILVDASHYTGPFRVAKGVRITCADGTVLHGGIRFEQVPAGQTATLANPLVQAAAMGTRSGSAVVVLDCPGFVSLENCSLTTTVVIVPGGGGHTLSTIYAYSDPCVLVRQSSLALTRCRFTGGWGAPSLEVAGSVVHLSGCTQFAPGAATTVSRTIFGMILQ